MQLRKLLLAGVAAGAMAIASAQGAAAQDPAFIDEIPAHWTGFYAGVHMGAGWSDKRMSVPSPFIGKDPVRTSGDLDGLLGGLTGGYNFQSGNWVYGVEGEISWSDMDGSFDCDEVGYDCTADINWIATLTGRLGTLFADGRGLFYGKGGVAWVDEEYCFAGCEGRVDQTRDGWVLGVGLEYLIRPNLTAKIEYNYMDFGKERLVGCDSEGEGCGPTVDQTVQTVRLGLNYHFNWTR